VKRTLNSSGFRYVCLWCYTKRVNNSEFSTKFAPFVSPAFSHLHFLSLYLLLQKQEIQELRKEGKASLAKVNDGGGDLSLLDEALGESIRGLEHGLSVFDQDGTSSSALDEGDNASVTALASLDRSQRRKNIVETILCQQHEQKESGIYDVKGLQVTSAACTQWARDRAQDQAKKDFDDAVKVWKEDALCAALLPSMLKKKKRISVIRRSGSLTSEAERRKTALDSISATLSSALEELDDIDF